MAIIQPQRPRRRQLRLPSYDYAQPGAYFVTICTHRRVCLLGRIVDGAMDLSTRGTIAESCWRLLPEHYPSVELDAFVIMPNHVHGILFLTDGRLADQPGQALPKRHGLPEVVRAFKTFSARRINALCGEHGTPVWQRGFYEHIVRNEISLQEVRSYIAANPMRWHLDRENPVNARRSTPVGVGFKPTPTKDADAR